MVHQNPTPFFASLFLNRMEALHIPYIFCFMIMTFSTQDGMVQSSDIARNSFVWMMISCEVGGIFLSQSASIFIWTTVTMFVCFQKCQFTDAKVVRNIRGIRELTHFQSMVSKHRYVSSCALKENLVIKTLFLSNFLILLLWLLGMVQVLVQ